LYTPSLLQTLREDFAAIPALLAEGPPEQPGEEAIELDVAAIDERERDSSSESGEPDEASQLGLF
jgi:hypothetical protein